MISRKLFVRLFAALSVVMIGALAFSVFSANAFRDIRSGNPGCIWNLSILQSFKELEYAHRQWNEDAKMSFPYRIIPCAVGDNLDTNFTSEAEHHIYRGFWSEALWNKYRAAVITFNQALLARLDENSPPLMDQIGIDIMGTNRAMDSALAQFWSQRRSGPLWSHW